MTSVVVRPAVPNDAEALGRCHLACWREAYADLVDPARLAPFLADVDGFVERWWGLDGRWPVRVADAGDRLVGLASARPASGEAVAHLSALYVRREHWSTGLGQRLLDSVLGDAPATLEVFRDNARARRFYARNGFVPDGTSRRNPASAASRSAWSARPRTPDPGGRRGRATSIGLPR